MLWKLICVFTLMGVVSCTTTPTQGGKRDAGSGWIHHVVFMKLKKPAHVEKLVGDCNRLLPTIPGVLDYWCGQHGDFGRVAVDDNYDVGLCIRFRSSEDYAIYVEHKNHIELVRAWKPHLEWLRVHDVVSNTP